MGHALLAIYWSVDREQATGVAATCEQLTGAGANLPTSLDHFHPLPDLRVFPGRVLRASSILKDLCGKLLCICATSAVPQGLQPNSLISRSLNVSYQLSCGKLL